MTFPPALLHAPPLEPDEDTGREWLLEELSKQEYQAAKPNPFDEFMNRLWDWLASLFTVDPDSPFGINPAWIFILIGIILVVILFAVFGRPRAIARRRSESGAVFLDGDERSAQELRAAAERAAANGDWSLATTERFRAISRALSDRTLIALRPGTTAQGVAKGAAKPFPDEHRALVGAANAFDRVRYLEQRVDESAYAHVRELDERLERTAPASPAAAGRAAR
ncbi:DUF4129 domain-containing protein [Gulosibacter sp. 10]|uniref:DUF4129 domain-containing protein n=1 Tax=Gulosibacter sp. 10 TaxID=1255570 RepID=UPI00097E8FC0|nr:DUF4129 domain-containing protein [Gulosibacter sp. 10]SJM54376.1 putative integral membrane protein [Gulosibacter sp. 10]